jgi:hypothetical protein
LILVRYKFREEEVMKKGNENSYQGYEVQKHRAIMTGKMGFQISVACLVAQLILLLLLIQLMVPFSPRARLVLAHCSAGAAGKGEQNARDRLPKWPHDAAGIVKASGRDMIRKISYKFVFTAPEAHWDRAILLSFLAWFLWSLGLRFFAKATVKIKDSEHIRGAQLITEQDIEAHNDGTGILPISRIIIPDTLSKRHLLIAGQTGSGKSTVLIQHLDKIQRAKRRAIVNDFKGELVERFYRPGIDLILNQLDTRGLGWTLFRTRIS